MVFQLRLRIKIPEISAPISSRTRSEMKRTLIAGIDRVLGQFYVNTCFFLLPNFDTENLAKQFQKKCMKICMEIEEMNSSSISLLVMNEVHIIYSILTLFFLAHCRQFQHTCIMTVITIKKNPKKRLNTTTQPERTQDP